MAPRRTPLRTSRSLSSGFLVVVATILVMVGVIYLWADNAVFNSDHFAATVVDSTKASAVRTELSRQIADQVVKAVPDLATIRPLIETVIETALSTPGVRRLLIPAVREVH